MATPHELTFSVPGPPVPKARPRTFVRQNKFHTVTPEDTRVAEARIADRFKAAYPHHRPLEGDLLLRLEFYLGGGHEPDTDNLVKTVSDALNARAWRDDRQIIELHARKIRGSETPRTLISIQSLGGDV